MIRFWLLLILTYFGSPVLLIEYYIYITIKLLVSGYFESGTIVRSGTFINFSMFWDLSTRITLVLLFDTRE